MPVGLGEQMRLVALDLEEKFAAFFHDGAGGFPLAVQGIGGADFAVEGREFFDQGRGGTLLATLGAFLLVVNSHRLRRAVFVLGQGEHPK